MKHPKTAILAVIILLLLFAPACGNRKETIEMKKIPDITKYTLIRPDVSPAALVKEAASLNSLMIASFGDSVIQSDWSENGSSDDRAPELLIGATNRAQSADAATRAASMTEAENWFYIGISGKKIIITGNDENGICAGIRYFRKNCIGAASGNTISIPADHCFEYTVAEPSVAEGNFIVSADLSDAPYYADDTGTFDITALLQNAIDSVGAAGGGTVYLPAGFYRISSTLIIPSYVTLRGDYADPDITGIENGTVLIADGKRNFLDKSMVRLTNSSAVRGLAFYYEYQDPAAPTEYYATIDTVAGAGVWTVRECTFVNSYIGLVGGDRPKGMTTVDRLKGTVLKLGMDALQNADICVYSDISLSPSYWAKAGERFAAPDEAAIRSAMKQLKAVGIYLGDCDRDTFENISLDGFETAVYNCEMTRSGLSGSWYALTVTDAVTGMDCHGIDKRYGLHLVNSSITAETAVANRTEPVGENDSIEFAVIRLLNSEVHGELVGSVSVESTEFPDETLYTRRATADAVAAKPVIFDAVKTYGADATGASDTSGALQSALDAAEKNGGGYVYLRAGMYRLDRSVTVGAGTVLCGVMQNAQTSGTDLSGTILLVYYGRSDEAGEAAVTVAGDDAGISGVTFIYPENGVHASEYETQTLAGYSYAVRCTGDRAVVNYLSFAATSRGICFDGSDGFMCDRVLGCFYHNGIRIENCEGCIVSRLHTNGTYNLLGAVAAEMFDPDWLYKGTDVYNIIDRHICPSLVLLRVIGSDGIQLDNCFHYGAKNYLALTGSSVTVINGEAARVSGYPFVFGGDSDLRVINFIRPGGDQIAEGMDATCTYDIFNCNCAFALTSEYTY